ncbi:MAG: hypothetical protein ACLFQB_15385 [Chitinispirillaceae bacterium]
MKEYSHEPRSAAPLGPSKFSADGFLGTDGRKPEEIIADDLSTLQDMGIRRESLTGALREIYSKAESALGNPVRISPRLKAEHFESRGKIPSPFDREGLFPKGEVELSDEKTGRTVIFTPLSIYLVEKHGFFQGKGSRYRLEPEEVADMLELMK